ncbi:MAG: nucleotide sugar dehydrogenase [Bacteroidetes bacterium]|nr:nucleotide sugar dehydrogenase [Bacteroidota bacterium]
MDTKIGVIGLWHLGCVISSSWAKLGYEVVGFDYDEDRISKLSNFIPPIFEPDLAETIKQGIADKLLHYTSNISDLSDCDFVFLCYDTPVRDDDSSDTSILDKSVDDVMKVMKDDAILIISSQSPVGYCNYLRKKIKDYNNTLDIAYSPENLRLGEAIFCYLNPGRIILGTADLKTQGKCLTLFSKISETVLTMGLESSEMVKHGINSFLSMSIVFANHLSDICEIKGARIEDVVRGIKSDIRIGPKAYLAPGIGFSGGTLGRDLKVLDSVNSSSSAGYAKLFGIIHDLNAERPLAIVSKVEKVLQNIEDKCIGILGLTYKPGTSTLRRSLPLEIVDLLLKKNAHVKVYDPKADYSELDYEPKFEITNAIEEATMDADIIILLTEWNEFKDYDWSRVINSMRNKIFYDTKNFLNEKEMKAYGFIYHSIGK